eukprot:PhM_4_TR2228/c0_g1_i1/m.25719
METNGITASREESLVGVERREVAAHHWLGGLAAFDDPARGPGFHGALQHNAATVSDRRHHITLRAVTDPKQSRRVDRTCRQRRVEVGQRCRGCKVMHRVRRWRGAPRLRCARRSTSLLFSLQHAPWLFLGVPTGVYPRVEHDGLFPLLVRLEPNGLQQVAPDRGRPSEVHVAGERHADGQDAQTRHAVTHQDGGHDGALERSQHTHPHVGERLHLGEALVVRVERKQPSVAQQEPTSRRRLIRSADDVLRHHNPTRDIQLAPVTLQRCGTTGHGDNNRRGGLNYTAVSAFLSRRAERNIRMQRQTQCDAVCWWPHEQQRAIIAGETHHLAFGVR